MLTTGCHDEDLQTFQLRKLKKLARNTQTLHLYWNKKKEPFSSLILMRELSVRLLDSVMVCEGRFNFRSLSRRKIHTGTCCWPGTEIFNLSTPSSADHQRPAATTQKYLNREQFQ